MYPMLTGLGAEQTQLDTDIDGLLLAHTRPTQGDVVDFLKQYVSGEARNIAARALIARGIPTQTVANAMAFLQVSGTVFNKRNVMGVLSIASALVSGVHGYRRNNGSIGWAFWWFVAGTIFPVVTPALGVAQGLWKPRKVG